MLKKKQPQIKTRHNIKLALATLFLLVLFLGFAKIHQFTQFLNSAYGAGLKSPNTYALDNRFTQNIGFIAQNEDDLKIGFLSLDSIGKKGAFLDVPPQTYMEAPKGFGFWTVESIYKLGQEEKEKIGTDLLKLSLARLTGLHIDGVVILNNPEGKKLSGILINLNNPIEMAKFLKNSKSTLSALEFFSLTRSISSVREDNLKILDLEKSVITESKLLPDQSRVLGVNNVKLDLFIREKLADPVVVDESISIAIFNATPHAGLASQASRLITNMGGNVSQLLSTDQYENQSKVISGEENLTKIRIAQIFAPICLRQKCETGDPKVLSSRAQVNIVLGEDYYNLWYKKQ